MNPSTGFGSASPAPLLSSSTDRGERGLQTLRDTQRVANETEELGANIMGQLHDQRQQLQGAIERRDDIQDDLEVSSNLIRRMFWRSYSIKAVLCVIILILCGTIGVLVYLKIRSPESHPPPSPPPPKAKHPPPPSPHGPLGRLLSEAADPSLGPRLLTEGSDPTIGPGLITVLAIGGVFLVACFFACAAKPAKRFGVTCGLGAIYLVLVLVLVLAPKKDYTGVPDEGLVLVTDVSGLLRVLLAVFLVLFAVIGLVGVLVLHLAATQRNRTFNPEEPLGK